MKKIVFTLVITFAMASSYAQNVNDALLYSQDNSNGTARFRAMGGAFGALGGDLSSLNVNPAGSVIFTNTQVGISLNSTQTANDATFFGTKRTAKETTFDANQAGAVLVVDANTNSGWQKFAFALNIENNKNFTNKFNFAGTNTNNSIANYFLSYANGIPLRVLNNFSYDELFYREQQAYLGYNAFIIDPVNNTSGNTAYTSAVLSGRYNQESATITSGNNGKATFNVAAQYEDKLSIGLNLNSHFSELRQSSVFLENNSNNTSTTDNYVKRIRFNNDIYTVGSGFSFQIGAIYKPTKALRLGFSFDSPTWYRFTDEISQSVSATSGTVSTELPADVVVPLQGDVIVYEPYTLQTPAKFTGSAAYIFGKRGLISVDFSTKDYKTAKFRPTADFINTNAAISQNLNTSHEIRVGGEYKIKKVSIRGGYRWEESPYKLKSTVGDLTAYSGGLGYNFGGTKLDVAYSRSQRFTNQSIFSQGFLDAPHISTINNSVTVTLLFEL